MTVIPAPCHLRSARPCRGDTPRRPRIASSGTRTRKGPISVSLDISLHLLDSLTTTDGRAGSGPPSRATTFHAPGDRRYWPHDRGSGGHAPGYLICTLG